MFFGIYQIFFSFKKSSHEPWTAPTSLQKTLGCVIGVDYPNRIVDLEAASKRNIAEMQKIRELLSDGTPPHCRPSNDREIRDFLLLSEEFVEKIQAVKEE